MEDLWNHGLISGEMHLGTGEEAVAAGVVTQLQDGDGLALTHRCSPALVVRGVPLVSMLRELLGAEDGLCGGRGGHMHLFSKEHLAATSGIVGASLPTAAGFALANRRLRPGAIAVAFTGAGAMTQMMSVMAKARRGATRDGRGDPITAVHKAMKKHEAERNRIDAEVSAEIEAAVAEALAGVGEGSDA